MDNHDSSENQAGTMPAEQPAPVPQAADGAPDALSAAGEQPAENAARQGTENQQRNQRPPRQDGRRPDDREQSRPQHLCPICGKPVTELFSAIAYKETGEPAHFECVLRVLAGAENIAADEKVVYLGNGAFGVVPASMQPGQKVTVKRMIPYENKDKKLDWRKEISTRYTTR